MERVDKTDKSFQFFFGAGCGSKTIIYVAAKKFWFGTVELIENLFSNGRYFRVVVPFG